MWQALYKNIYEKMEDREQLPTGHYLPNWLVRYLKHRFQMLDRSGDGVIDAEEYEYTMEHLGVSPSTARKAFKLITEVHQSQTHHVCTGRGQRAH